MYVFPSWQSSEVCHGILGPELRLLPTAWCVCFPLPEMATPWCVSPFCMVCSRVRLLISMVDRGSIGLASVWNSGQVLMRGSPPRTTYNFVTRGWCWCGDLLRPEGVGSRWRVDGDVWDDAPGAVAAPGPSPTRPHGSSWARRHDGGHECLLH
jgi:hypothetical protein